MAGRANVLVGAVIAMAVVAAVAVIAMPRAAGGPAELRAVVHDGDGAAHELPLAQDGEITVVTSLGTNVVAVEGGAVFVRDADCPNHDCIRQGRIDAPGGQIVCLPHELWIEVVGPDGGDGVGAGGSAGGGSDGTGSGSSAGGGADGAGEPDVTSR